MRNSLVDKKTNRQLSDLDTALEQHRECFRPATAAVRGTEDSKKNGSSGNPTYLQRVLEHGVGVFMNIVEVLGFKDVVAGEFALLRGGERLLFRRFFRHTSDRRLDRVGGVDRA